MHSIYLVRSETEHILQWKIGVTKNPEKRLNELRTANPNLIGFEDTYVIRDKEIAYKVEALLKTQLAEFNIDGEWFLGKALNKKKFIELCIKAEDSIKMWKTIQNEIAYNKKIVDYNKKRYK